MPRSLLLLALALLLPALGGCVVVSVTSAVVGAGVTVASTAVSAGVAVGKGAVKVTSAVLSDDEEEQKEKAEKDQ